MSQPFYCGNAARRKLIVSITPPVVNGIDYLEVIDHAAPTNPPYPPQQTLVLKLFYPVPAGLGPANIRITGGVRFTKIDVVSAQPLTAMALTPEEHAYYDPRYPTADDQARVLVIRTDTYGDYSAYRLSLQIDPDHPTPPAGFDPVLSDVEFWFKVECRSDYDCKTTSDCPPAVIEAPAIDYLAKDYASFRRVMLDRLSVISPNWAERDPADTGIMIAELLAYTADQLSYYQDAIATEAYLGTARRRISVRRHARLLDYFVHEGANARTFACFQVDDTVGPDGVLLPRINPDQSTTKVMTLAGTDVRLDPDPTVLRALIASANPTIFEPMHDAVLYAQHNEIQFYTWGDEACCLPAGATSATLADDASARLCLMAGDVLIFEEKLGHTAGLGPDPRRRQAVRLTKVTPSAKRANEDPGAARTPGDPIPDPLTGSLYVSIEWHADDALAQPICITSTTQVGRIAAAVGNCVLVDHGRTIEEPLSPATFTDARRYRPVLTKPEITHGVPIADPTSADLAVAAVLAQDPHATVPAVTLAGGGLTWTATPDLLGAGPFDTSFVVEMDEGGYAELRFGDDKLGRGPIGGLLATYRVGRGPGGNVGPDTLVQVMTSATGIIGVRNPLAGVGGCDPEPIDDVKHYAPEAFRIQERAVTEADYATCAMRHPDVHRAVATRRWTGSWYTTFVTVERRRDQPLDDTFRDDIVGFLDRYRLAGEDLEIEAPVYVPLALTVVVCCKAGYFRDKVEQALRRAFSTGRGDDGAPAFFAPERFTFGDKVYLSQVIAKAMQVPGVDWVDPTDTRFVFRRANDADTGEKQRGYITLGRLEIAECLSSPSEPERGRIDFVLDGGQ